MPTLRRKPRSAALILADERARLRQHSITQLDECFGEFIPAKRLDHNQQGLFSRRRLFSKSNTFWAFFSQVLDAPSTATKTWALRTSPVERSTTGTVGPQ